MQLNLELSSGEVSTICTDDTWSAFNGDLHRKPGSAKHGNSAGTAAGIEYIDARNEPVGWKEVGFNSAGWARTVAMNASADQIAQLTPTMEPPMQYFPEVPVRSVKAVNKTFFIADLGRELQGGIRLSVGDGVAGQTVQIACGESLRGTNTGLFAPVGDTWGWAFTWTLRQGEQLLEQHKYMECRFIALVFSGETAPSNFTVSAHSTHEHSTHTIRQTRTLPPQTRC
jgi:hypothetical protein